MASQMPSVGYPTHFGDQLLAELIETGSETIKISAYLNALVDHLYAVLIQTKANCEVKKQHSKLVYLAS